MLQEQLSESFAVEVVLHQGSAFSSFLFAIIIDSLTTNIRKEPPWQTMFANDVVLCAKEKDVLKLELEQRRDCHGEERNESVKNKDI